MKANLYLVEYVPGLCIGSLKRYVVAKSEEEALIKLEMNDVMFDRHCCHPSAVISITIIDKDTIY